jgi:hypothetical protein
MNICSEVMFIMYSKNICSSPHTSRQVMEKQCTDITHSLWEHFPSCSVERDTCHIFSVFNWLIQI